MNVFRDTVDKKSQNREQDHFWVGSGFASWLDNDANAQDWKSLSSVRNLMFTFGHIIC